MTPATGSAMLRATQATSLRKGARHMKLSQAIHEYLDDCRLRKLGRGTLISYENSLGFLLKLAMVHGSDQVRAMSPELIRYYFDAASGKGNAVATLLKKRAAIREFAAWGLKRRLWLADPALDAPRYQKPERLPRPFDRGDRHELMALDLPTEERLLRALLYYAGLRAAEVLALKRQDVRLGEGEKLGRLVVLGKGQRERMAPIMPELDAVLRGYLAEYAKPPQAWLLARPDGRPWSYRMLLYRVSRWGSSASVLTCRPHRWRHTAATELFEAGVDPRAAQKVMGHASLTTTMLYTQVVDDAVDRAAMQRSQMRALPGFQPVDSLRAETGDS